MTKAQMLASMDVSMGGRAAEELIFGQDKVTSGASSDFVVNIFDHLKYFCTFIKGTIALLKLYTF